MLAEEMSKQDRKLSTDTQLPYGGYAPGATRHHPQHHSILKSRLLCYTLAFAVMLYACFLAAYSQTSFPTSLRFASHVPYLMDKPVGEDGYYMLTVAENIARHGHIVYNRGLTATGIQPLATLAYALLYWLVEHFDGSNLDLIRWVLISGTALFIVFAFQIARLTASLAPRYLAVPAYTLAFLLVITDYTLFRLFNYGLETGIYLCLLTLCFASVRRIIVARQTSLKEMLVLGVAAGLSGEARIDFGLVFLVLLLILRAKQLISIPRAAGASSIAMLIMAPWFAFLHHATGSWMPSSGKAESTLITLSTTWERIRVMFLAASGHVVPWSYGGVSLITSIVTLFGLAALIALFKSPVGRKARAEAPLAFALAKLWLPSMLVLVVIYIIFFNSTHFYYRYSAPAAILVIPLLAIVLSEVSQVRRNLIIVSSLLVCSFCLWTGAALHSGRIGNSQTIAAGYIHQRYPNAHVGAFQSGVVGYFNPNVENLDGKLNMQAWKASRQHRLGKFIDQEQIDVLVDWPSVLQMYLPQSYLNREWQPCPVAMTGTESICLVRKHLVS